MVSHDNFKKPELVHRAKFLARCVENAQSQNAPIPRASHALAFDLIVAFAQTRRVGHHEWIPLDIQRYLHIEQFSLIPM
jgi:hypothetical protein